MLLQPVASQFFFINDWTIFNLFEIILILIFSANFSTSEQFLISSEQF